MIQFWLRWRAWIQRLAAYCSAQGIVLLINAFSGLLLVRAMGKEEYALFTITNSMLATISILTDSGLGSAMSSLGGPICHDRPKFAELLALTKRLRFTFMTAALVVGLPVGIYMLNLNKASPWTCFMLTLVTIVTAIPAAEIAMLSAANRLHSRLRQILQADSTMSLTRLGLVLLGGYAGLGAILASAITAISQWLQLMLLRRQTHDLSSVPHKNTGAFRKPMVDVVKHMIPICAFTCVQGHITTWVLSIFANTSAVADVGALSRLGLLMSFLSLPLQNIVFPMIARAVDPKRLLRLSMFTILTSLGIAVLLVSIGIACSVPILWLLGPKYGHLEIEMAWYLGYLALGFLANTLWGIALTRSWVKHGWLHIPMTIVAQIAGTFFLDLSSAVETIVFAGISPVTGILIGAVLVWRGLKRANRPALADAATV